MTPRLEKLESQIESVKREVLKLGPMRPGSISKQYRRPAEKKHPFYQISYTHRMRSRSEYVRKEHLRALRLETAEFKRFKKWVEVLVALSLRASKMRVERLKEVRPGGRS